MMSFGVLGARLVDAYLRTQFRNAARSALTGGVEARWCPPRPSGAEWPRVARTAAVRSSPAKLNDLDETLDVEMGQCGGDGPEVSASDEEPLDADPDPLLRAMPAVQGDDLQATPEPIDHDHVIRLLTCGNALAGAAGRAMDEDR